MSAPRVPTQVTVTGAAGQVAYSLLFRIASGALLGPDQPVVLRLLEVDVAMGALEGVAMELDDCAFPLLADVELTSDLDRGFEGTQFAFLVGGATRRPGMERGELLAVNGSIFKAQGRALERNAASDVRILVVGNPCNTNCLIARANAPSIPDDRWFAMTRLDENRATAQLAKKAGVSVRAVSKVAIWGNHSATQFPDYAHAEIAGRPAPEVIRDDRWLHEDFLVAVRQRAATLMATRGLGSAASAASAAIDSIRSVIFPTPEGTWHSLAVCSHGEYGVPEGLQFSFPICSDGETWEIVEGLEHGPFEAERLAITTQELLAERAEAAQLLA